MNFIKKFVTLALVVASILTISVSCFAEEEIAPLGETTVTVNWTTVTPDHLGGPHAACIYQKMSKNSTILLNLSEYNTVEVILDTGTTGWVRARKNGIEGYMPTVNCGFTNSTFYTACFGGHALQRGFKGQPVVNLQLGLINAGYDLKADGIFGSATKNAVEAFQKKHDLSVDGIAGKNTAIELMEYWY